MAESTTTTENFGEEQIEGESEIDQLTKNETEDEEEEEQPEEVLFDEEIELVEDEVKFIKRRCQRKKKTLPVCFDEEFEEQFEGEPGVSWSELCTEEEEEEGEEWEEEASVCSTILSAISFQWKDEIYEFEELCDTGTIGKIYNRFYEQYPLPDDDGRRKYLSMCKTLSVTPTLRFYNALRTSEIDLGYRGIDSRNIRAMCAALDINLYVARLILKYNRLTEDDCYYLGLMLSSNDRINELDLTACRIGPRGAEILFKYLAQNYALETLSLSKCFIQDEGMKNLANAFLARSNSITNLDLSYNRLGDEAAEALGTLLGNNKSLKRLNLRYNFLFSPSALKLIFRGLQSMDSLTHLDLSWNGINGEEAGNLIFAYLKKTHSLEHLDLSDNRLEGVAVVLIARGMARSKKIEALKIGKNPIAPEDLDKLIVAAKSCKSLKLLDLEELWVNKSFIQELQKIPQTRNLKVNYAGIYENFEVLGPDYAKLILKRAQYEAMKPKKKKKRKDFGHFIWGLGDEPLSPQDFMTQVTKFKAKIKKELFPELIKEFLNPKTQLIDVVAMREKYLSIFPDSEPPPAPKVKSKKSKAAERESESKMTEETEYWLDFDEEEGEGSSEEEDQESEDVYFRKTRKRGYEDGETSEEDEGEEIDPKRGSHPKEGRIQTRSEYKVRDEKTESDL